MFCVGIILYEMLLPPIKTYFERRDTFDKARVGESSPLLHIERSAGSNCERDSV